MSGILDRVANAAIALAAVVLVWFMLQRELKSRSMGTGESPSAVVDFYPNWESLDSASILLDDSPGPTKVYVFSDLECPYCAAFHEDIMPALYRNYGRTVSVRFVQYPLKTHRFARQAAVALECAHEQERARSFLDLVYSKQDSIGLIPWRSFAVASGIGDPDRFTRCIQNDRSGLIDAGMSVGRRFDVISTPTVIVSGWRFTGLPDSAAFLAAIDSIRNGAAPVVTASLK